MMRQLIQRFGRFACIFILAVAIVMITSKTAHAQFPAYGGGGMTWGFPGWGYGGFYGYPGMGYGSGGLGYGGIGYGMGYGGTGYGGIGYGMGYGGMGYGGIGYGYPAYYGFGYGNPGFLHAGPAESPVRCRADSAGAELHGRDSAFRPSLRSLSLRRDSLPG